MRSSRRTPTSSRPRTYPPLWRSRSALERCTCARAITGCAGWRSNIRASKSVYVKQQNRKEFEELLGKALAINPDELPDWRLTNLVMQRRARWLLARKDELFVE